MLSIKLPQFYLKHIPREMLISGRGESQDAEPKPEGDPEAMI